MKKIIVLMTSLLLAAGIAAGQNFRSAYFLEGNRYAYRMNPALNADTDFRSGIANYLSVDTRTTMGLRDFLFPVDDHLATGLNQNVPAETFLSRLNENNRVAATIDMGIVARGWRKGDVYYTVDASLRSSDEIDIPYDLFLFLKDGTRSRTSFDLSSLLFASENYLELSYGQTRNLDGNFRYGFRIKPLIGISRFRFNADHFNMDLNADQWVIRSKAEVEIAGNQFSCSTETSDGKEMLDVTSLDFRFIKPGIAGVGVAVDMGVVWDVNSYLTLGASVQDLGLMQWFNKAQASTPDVVFKGNIVEKNESLDSDIDSSSRLLDVAEFYVRDSRNPLRRIPLGANVSASMKMPFNEDLSFSFLGSMRSTSSITWVEGRAYVNWNPLDWLSTSVNIARHSFGWNAGGAVSFITKEFNFFIGTDSYIFKITPQLVPAGRANFSVAIGLSYPIS